VPSDPLAGLVTGAAGVPERTVAPPPVPRAPGAPEVDSTMREAIDAALAQERRPTGRQVARRPRSGKSQPYGRPAQQPAQRGARSPVPAAQAGRPANAAGCLVAVLVFLVAILFGAGRMIIDWLTQVFR
jgi:hypothetical protein